MAKKDAKNRKLPAFLRKGAMCAVLGAGALAGGLLTGCDEAEGVVNVPAGTNFYYGVEPPTLADNPANDGDFYIETGDGDVWQYTTEDGWDYVTNLKGEPGKTGPQGETGKNGVGLKNVTVEPGFDLDGNMYIDMTFHYTDNSRSTDRMYPNDTIYVGEHMSLQTAVNEIAVNGTIVLNNDVDLTTDLIVNRQAKIDLNGHKIANATAIWDDDDAVERWSLISVKEGGDLTITDSNPTAESGVRALKNDCYGIDIRGGKCTIDGAYIEGNISAVYVEEGELIVNDGHFSIQQLSESWNGGDERFTLNCWDKNYEKGAAKITVNGGTFENYNPANNLSEGANTNYVSEGKVVINYETEPGVQTYKMFTQEEALAMISGIPAGLSVGVTLCGDFELESQLNVTSNMVLDLNGYTVSNSKDIWNDSSKAWSLISVNGGNLTIKNGTVDAKENDCYAIDVRNGGKCTIESGEYIGNVSAVYVLDGELIVNGGLFDIKQLPNKPNDSRYTLNCLDENYKKGTAKITVTGGTFANYDPEGSTSEYPTAKFLADGYDISVSEEDANGDVWYTVIAK